MNGVNINKKFRVGVTLKRNGKYEDVELRMFVRKGNACEPTQKVMFFGVRQIGGLIEALEKIRSEMRYLPFDEIDMKHVTWISE